YDNKLKVVCIASGFLNIHYGLSISHPNEFIRKLAIEKLKECINFASKIDAEYVSIGLIRGKIIDPLIENGRRNIIKSLIECGKCAQEFNISLLIEPENRYETSYIHTVKEGMKILEEIGMNNFGLMIDTYHMNIEESNIEKAVKDASRKLLHVHLADNNRLAPGMGYFDFKSFIKYLKEVNYDSFLGIEVDPLPSLDIAIRESIKFIKNIV
ncbi:MAG: sugar phosphate isomerase/epimerase family protein, partial [Candidatus Aenigmatarchaeota archaeon]